jgi:IS5 family transposase
MRKNDQKQLPLSTVNSDHTQVKELEAISSIIDSHPTLAERILQDLNRGKIFKSKGGAKGMTADQVLRIAIVMILFGFTYEELAFHISDSESLRRFCRIGFGARGFKKSALNANIKRISPETWEVINRELLGYAQEQGIEKGRQVRIDCTVVETNIHKPNDAVQLWDCVRVLMRLLYMARDFLGAVIPFTDHERRAKRRMVGIQNAKTQKDRTAKYSDLLKVTRRVVGYAKKAVPLLEKSSDIRTLGLIGELNNFISLTERVIDQTERREIRGEKVPASEKVLSIFEDHTDIIIKDKENIFFGHKICLTGGASNLILDCKILEGNPAASTLVKDMLDRQQVIYGRPPLKPAFDGGFASKNNLAAAKDAGVKDVCFAKKRGLEETDMCRSEYVYNRLRRFRAGIESGISWLKRSFGLTRCTWKGFDSFKSYVLSAVVVANLLTIARNLLTAV